MYSNIAIPLAFEQDKDPAQAMELAQRIASPEATITFLHAIEIPQPYIATYIPPDLMETGRTEARKKLKEIAEQIPGAQTALLIGPAGRAITSWAETHKADCIVIASHRPVFSDLLLGSTAAWVVRHAPCAVHVLR